jgi:hypothetical protein
MASLTTGRFRTLLAGAWLLAGVMVACAIWVGAPRASAAAPEVDTLIPTGNANSPCVAAGTAGEDGDCRTDNSVVSYYMDSAGDYALETPDRAAVQAAVTNIYNPTDLTVTFDSTPTYSGSAETDIIFQEGSTNFPDANTVGVTWCNSPVVSSIHQCDQTNILIRGLGNYSETSVSHEMGHAVGLVHPSAASPSYSNPCEAGFHVMRAALSCITGPELGLMLTRNINYIY